jgi:hypothetical protein
MEPSEWSVVGGWTWSVVVPADAGGVPGSVGAGLNGQNAVLTPSNLDYYSCSIVKITHLVHRDS